MKTPYLVAVVAFAAAWKFPAPAQGEEVVVFQSRAGARTSLLELYTSEGCSSCPPAEAWLSRLKANPRLWTEWVPVAFHVDYWDHLGWRDRFASGAFTARQREYGARWGGETIYTPEFVLDGREWRGLGEPPTADRGGSDPGALAATVRGHGPGRTVTVSFAPAAQPKVVREASVTLLGFDLRSAVRGGENRGRALSHDFVALGGEKKALSVVASGGASGRQEATIRLPDPPPEVGSRLAVAVWVSEAGKPGAEQAVGGWLTAPAVTTTGVAANPAGR